MEKQVFENQYGMGHSRVSISPAKTNKKKSKLIIMFQKQQPKTINPKYPKLNLNWQLKGKARVKSAGQPFNSHI